MSGSIPQKTKGWWYEAQSMVAGETKVYIYDEEDRLIGEFFSFKGGKTNAKKNALLAVSATNMLEALKAALIKLKVFRSNTNGEYQGGMEFSSLEKMIEEAIAKAEGK